jgi:type IV pilus assembly protein PilA
MFCNHCGREVPDNSPFCNNCGANLATATPAVPYPVVPPPGPTETVPTSGKATASLICGILGLTIFSILTAIPAIIFGHMSRKEIRESGGRLKGDGMALAGMIMGYIATGLVVLIVPILIIAAIAIPNLLRSRMAANEASALGSVRTISVSNVTYSATYERGFAPSLLALGGSGEECKNPSAERSCLIDDVLASGTKSGYNFAYEAADSDGDGTLDKFWLRAAPSAPGSSGQSEFCMDESGVIRKETSGECTVESAIME